MPLVLIFSTFFQFYLEGQVYYIIGTIFSIVYSLLIKKLICYYMMYTLNILTKVQVKIKNLNTIFFAKQEVSSVSKICVHKGNRNVFKGKNS